MAHATHQSMRRAILVALAALLLLQPSRAQQGDHWVGTWMVAHIGRPQNPPAPPAPPAAAPGTTTAPPAAPPAFMHFNNQTLRQIVRTSIGGTRARVVLSNAFGTAPLTVGAAHIAVRDKESTIVASSPRADVQRQADTGDPVGCRAGQRSDRPGSAGDGRPGDRSLPAGQH